MAAKGKGDLATGIYFGWSKLHDIIYPVVVSVGWNPFFSNTVKTIEAHLLHSDPIPDFYGEHLTLYLLGYLRQESNFRSVDELISCIQEDIRKCKDHLQLLKFDPTWT